MGRLRTVAQRAAVRLLWGRPARRTAAYSGASAGYLANWWASLLSADETLRYEIATLRARSRSLVQSSGEAAGVLEDFATEIVGHGGIRLQVRLRNNRRRLVDELNDPIEEAWRLWGRRGTCTADGAHSWTSLQRLAVRTMVLDGEFWAFRLRGEGPFGYRLQPFDADLVDHELTRTEPDGTRIVMGVELDRWGAPAAYHIWDRHPSESAGRLRRRVPASDVLHVFRRLRPGQTRGVPFFAPVLLHFKSAERHTEAELMASIVAAAQGGFFEQKEYAPDIEAPTGDIGQPLPLEMSAEPGLARLLPKGVEFKAWSPTHPTTTFGGFMKVVKRMIARGLGRSYHALTGDLESVTYSSLRTDRLREMDANRSMQAELIEQVCEPVFADWLAMAQIAGRVPVLATPDQILAATRWQGRGWDWVDPLKDSQGAAIDLALGITTRGRLAAQKGLDFYEIIDELAEENAYAAERGVPLSSGPSTYAVQVGGVPPADDPATASTTTTDDARARLRRIA